jgi:hypothetical protein
VAKAKYLPQQVNVPQLVHRDQYYLGNMTIRSATTDKLKGVPKEYEWHSKVFSEKASQQLPDHTIWDHAIELLLGAPSMLLGCLLLLTQEEIEEACKFIKEHLK